MICAAISDLRLIRFELAFEHLNNLLDPRFAEATKRTLPPSPEEARILRRLPPGKEALSLERIRMGIVSNFHADAALTLGAVSKKFIAARSDRPLT